MLMGLDPRPLAGRTVLVTRPAGRGGDLGRILEQLGAEVEARPTIALEAPWDPGPAERAIARLSTFSWVLFTSASGVRYFFELRGRRHGDASSWAGALAAIGPATEQALGEQGCRPNVVAAEAHAEGLTDALRGRVAPSDRVLVVAPEERRETLADALRELGPTVEVVPFYRNVPAPGVTEIARDVAAGRYAVAVFTSPSTLHRLIDAGAAAHLDVARALGRMTLVAIGQRTAGAIADLGLALGAVAERPTDAAIAHAVVEACGGASSPVLASPPRRSDTEESSFVTSPAACLRTPLHAEHVAAGARMVEFAGWHMPIQYAGVIEEHLAVRTRAGLFDVSHMGEVAVRGPQAVAFLQYVTCNDVARLEPGRAQYTGLMTPGGGFVDDLLIYRLGPDELLAVINAANTAKDVAWLAREAAAFDVELRDASAEWSQIALQGPRAVEILAPLCTVDLADVKYYHFRRADVLGAPCIVSRTGYTGEDGFELYAPADAAAHLWRTLLETGAAVGLAPVGLGARDTLRLEAKMALYGNDIDETTTPWEADLGWIVRLAKGEFVGKAALAAQKERGIERRLVGFEMSARAIARHGYPVLHGGREIARVTSGSHAPYLKKNIGLAYLPLALTSIGTRVEIDVRGRSEPAEVVPTPFYRRAVRA